MERLIAFFPLGSLAAGAQSGIGSVVAPSLFATLQSAGAGGYGVSAVYGAVQGVAALGTGGGLLASFRKKKAADKDREGDEEKKGGEDGEESETDDEGKDEDKPRL